MNIISLGAGVQSSTMALMAARGELEPMPEVAIFADTGWEPAEVYAWLAHLEGLLPFPVLRVSNGNIRDDLLRSSMRGTHAKGSRAISPPLFTEGGGMVRRQCTEEYKLKPLRRKQRELLGLAPGERFKGTPCSMWVGISTDEAQRMKPSRHTWAENRWPLIEAGMSRADCLRWLERHDYPQAPRSACIGCPFRSDREWLALSPAAFEDACQVEEALEPGFFLHAERRPLREVSFNIQRAQQDLWGNECEGMCGV